MSEKVFALTAADRNKLEEALLVSQKALEGVPGALVDVRRRAFQEAAQMVEEYLREMQEMCRKENLLLSADILSIHLPTLAARLRAEAGEG